MKVVAVSDKSGGVYNENGLKVQDVIAHARQRKFLAEYSEAQRVTNAELLTLDCDVLVPAAMENVITSRNAGSIKARIICEGANGPTTAGADRILEENGVFVIPDILANAGGVTVSYFEWVQGLDNFFWDMKRVQDELQKIMEKAFDAVNAKADEADCDYRTAAYTIAISRVAEACRLKGLFP